MIRVLLIEDDALLGKAIFRGLRQDYTADWFRSAEEGAEALLATEYDVLVLDINLPVMSGLEWLGLLRKQRSPIPVLLLTAHDTTQERVAGLNAGADDYLVKPFDFEELIARIRALSRRKPLLHTTEFTYGDVIFDVTQKTVHLHSELLPVSQKEFDILYLLVQNAGAYLTKQRIEEKIYGWDDVIGSNTIEVHISSLRRKLGKEFIQTTRNLGYRVKAQ
jgi:two-component system, OmpR family, response regulator QseB